jgi:hypothetical protein
MSSPTKIEMVGIMPIFFSYCQHCIDLIRAFDLPSPVNLKSIHKTCDDSTINWALSLDISGVILTSKSTSDHRHVVSRGLVEDLEVRRQANSKGSDRRKKRVRQISDI